MALISRELELLRSQVVLITGALTGIGRATAVALRHRGVPESLFPAVETMKVGARLFGAPAALVSCLRLARHLDSKYKLPGRRIGGSDGTRTRGLLRDRQAFLPGDLKGMSANGED
jgi:hypothetical protein